MNLANIIDSTVPISLFNRGQAGKIFDEVKKTGAKIVLKNNAPECILLSPQEYKDMIERFEDERDYAVAAERMSHFDESKLISWEDELKEAGITQEELDAMPDVEFE